jgi:hypothetical protein
VRPWASNAHGAAIIANYDGPNVPASLTPLNGPGRSEFTPIELYLFGTGAEWQLASTSIGGPVLPASNRKMVHTANFVSLADDCIAVAATEDDRSDLLMRTSGAHHRARSSGGTGDLRVGRPQVTKTRRNPRPSRTRSGRSVSTAHQVGQ